MNDYLTDIQSAIRKLHGCDARHIETVAVREVFKGKVVWDGEVEVFELTGHQEARKAYAWGYPNDQRGGKFDFVVVLQIPPVGSPQTAVKAAIVAKG